MPEIIIKIINITLINQKTGNLVLLSAQWNLV